MHRAGYEALGLPFVYVPFAVEESDLVGALAGMRALGIRGFGVSMPFKLSIIPLLDAIDPLAERIGAVNTVVNDDGRLTGYNTDAWGAERALAEALPLAGKRVVVIGAGGAARAAAFGFNAAGMRVHIVNRTREKAEALARAVGGDDKTVGAGGLAELEKLDVDAVVNCSSAGMAEYGDEVLAPKRLLRPGMVVMDIVYKPIRTPLLVAAERAGARTVHGGRMLLHQACRQFELYTGRDAPAEALDAALERSIGP
ncbi:MAG: shikimate dehydrogenase [Myxococcales bacterium]|nr:shikimate dehydrogenase [Myxococcales bacterium]